MTVEIFVPIFDITVKSVTSTSVFGDVSVSTHADPTSSRRAIFYERRSSIGRIGQRAGHADFSNFGLFEEQSSPKCEIP